MSNSNTNLQNSNINVLQNVTFSRVQILTFKRRPKLFQEVTACTILKDHTQEDHSHQTQAVNTDSLKVDLVVKQNSCSEKEDSNSETASSKSAKECSLNSETQDISSFTPSVLSKDDLKGTRIEHGFKWAFMSLFGQDVDTFTSTMLLNVDQLQKQLDKDKFQEGQQQTEQPEIIVEGRVDQYPETCQVKSRMLDSSPDNQITEYSKQSLESENILLKKTVA
ncbi:hypothetical protein Tco_0510866 [Tanacetum coccineum]